MQPPFKVSKSPDRKLYEKSENLPRRPKTAAARQKATGQALKVRTVDIYK